MSAQSIVAETIARPIASARQTTARTSSRNGSAFADMLTAAAPAQPAAQTRPLTLGGKVLPPLQMPGNFDLKGEMEKFAGDLRKRLSDAGIDTSSPVNFTMGADGSVLVRGSHPQKAAIEKMFEDDPELATRYRDIASHSELNAQARLCERYMIAWKAADDDEERRSIWERQVSMSQSISRAGGQLTLSDGTLSSQAMTMATGFLGETG